jgi:hypothetical protein
MRPSQIFDENKEDFKNYLESWGLIDKFESMAKAREDGDEDKLALAAHYAWYALPDRPAIRVHPFSQLCNMAEQIFGLYK